MRPMFELMRGDLARAARTPSNSPDSRASTICSCGRRAGFSRGLGDGSRRRGRRRARGHASRRSSFCASRTFCSTMAFKVAACRSSKPARAISSARSRSSTRRWRRRTDRPSRVRSGTASRCAAKSCSKRDPANPAPAEEAFQTAIAVAKQQGARSFELRAALSLAKLYQSTGRPAEAHAVLAPALEGFSPTPEMPEIAEAQALLAALAETDEVKAEAARASAAAAIAGRPTATRSSRRADTARRRRPKPSRRARKVAAWRQGRARTAGGRLRPMGRQLSAGRVVGDEGARRGVPQRRRGEARFARGRRRSPHSGITHWFAGEYVEAREHLERALALFQPGRDDDLAFRFGQDAGVAAMLYLALDVVAAGRRHGARSPSSATLRRGSRASPISARAHSGKCTRPCSN